jgi:calcineurin-like phosphoesterase family protein
MIQQWNSVTDDDDAVIVNGDFIEFNNCTKEQGYAIIDRLKGRHIILILGNHDRPHVQTLKEYGPRLEVIEYPILKDGFWIISHEPQYVSDAAPYANIFAHVHLNPMYRDMSSRSFCTSAERIGYRPILWDKVKEAVRNYGKDFTNE